MRLSNIALAVTALYPRVFMPGYSLGLDFTSGNRTLDKRITFSRTTNATVTGSNGLIQYAPHNLLTFSEQFDNAAWNKVQGGTGMVPVVTANYAAAPDGSLTADRVVMNPVGTAGSDISYIQQFVTSFTNGAGSIWLKTTSGNSQQLTLRTGTTDQIITITGSWTRFTGVHVGAGCDRLAMIAYGNQSGVRDLLIWGAQLELGSTATTYNPTTVKNLLGYTEHFDNAAWTKSNSFVQTNLVLQSEAITSSPWTVYNGSNGSILTPIASPNGSVNAIGLDDTAGAGYYGYTQNVALLVSTNNTFSLFVKQGTSTSGFSVWLVGSGSNTYFQGTISWVSGVPTATGWTATAQADGWYRISYTFAAGASTSVALYVLPTPTAPSATGSTYFWGAQLVQGTSAGDYKATYAAAAAVGYTDIYGQPFAQKLVADATNNVHYLAATVASINTNTYSIYVKNAGYNYIGLAINNAGALGAIFDLSTGAATYVGGSVSTYQATSIGSGWWRLSITATVTISTLQAYVLNNALNFSAFTGDGTSGIYIFGAQLSDSARVDPYVYRPVAAPSAAAYYGPRFDYDPVTLAPKGLLIEEQRTNLLLNSAVLNTQAVTTTATAHTLSFYGTGTIVLSGSSTGTVVGTGAYPTRTTLTFTPIVGVLTVTVTGSVTMAQLEAGAFATSYIPTVASQVTRAADSASMIGNNFARWYNATEGTLFAQYDFAGYSAFNPIFDIGADQNNLISLSLNSAVNSRLVVVSGGATQANIALGVATANTVYKQSGAYKLDDFASTRNGATPSTDTSGTVPVVTQAVIGGTIGLTRSLNGHVYRIAYYPRRLANTELQGITA